MIDNSLYQKPVVIVDKSFAQGTKYTALQKLAEDYIIVVTSGFYFETFTTLSESIRRIFAGFPEFRRVNTPRLCRLERESGRPTESMDAPRLNVNPDFVSGKRTFSVEEAKCLEDYKARVVIPNVEFWRGIIDIGLVGFPASEVNSVLGNISAFQTLCGRIRDVTFVRKVASELEIPHANLLDENWFAFRELQAKLLHGLTLRYMYPHTSSRSEIDLEHDVHDIDYLALGLHAKCFATNESKDDFRKLGWKFKFLCPEGRLLQSKPFEGKSLVLTF